MMGPRPDPLAPLVSALPARLGETYRVGRGYARVSGEEDWIFMVMSCRE